MKCPYCSAAQGRCGSTSTGRLITECTSCGRVVEERQTQSHHVFHVRAQDYPLCLVTSDLPTISISADEDPFEHTGFITAFSTWSLEPYPVFTQSSLSLSGHLSELERVLETTSSSSSGPSVVVDNLRAYLQIIDVASILRLESDIWDHAFELFRDCSSATCLRNRSVEALATAALVQAIREAQEPRTLQEISIAANLPQKEIGKYIKILGEALQLSQPLNSNSISVHMPRFCTLLQLNKSAQELATHIGEVVIHKCFCTRRNPISISAAAIYLACQLEDKRKTQAEICKVTGLTEVTLHKVYKELLENWDDLLPSNYTPAVPPEKAFPTATIQSGRSTTPRPEIAEGISLGRGKYPEANHTKPIDVSGACLQVAGRENSESKDTLGGVYNLAMHQAAAFWKPKVPSRTSMNNGGQNNLSLPQEMDIDKLPISEELEKKVDKGANLSYTTLWQGQLSSTSIMNSSSVSLPSRPPVPMGSPPSGWYAQMSKFTSHAGTVGTGTVNQNDSKKIHQNGDS